MEIVECFIFLGEQFGNELPTPRRLRHCRVGPEGDLLFDEQLEVDCKLHRCERVIVLTRMQVLSLHSSQHEERKGMVSHLHGPFAAP